MPETVFVVWRETGAKPPKYPTAPEQVYAHRADAENRVRELTENGVRAGVAEVTFNQRADSVG